MARRTRKSTDANIGEVLATRPLDSVDLVQATRPLAGGSQQDRALLGRGAYVDDIDLPGQLWMAVVRSPVAHGRIRDIDGTAAAEVSGVHAVLSGADLANVPRIPIRVLPQPEMNGREQPVIADGRVRYVGEPVAIVVADDPYLAEDAAELVMVDIDPLPVSVNAAGDDEPSLWDTSELPAGATAGNQFARFHSLWVDDSGSTGEGLHAVRARFSTQRHTAVPMETRGNIAEWDEGVLHVWGPTKFLTFTRRCLAQAFDIRYEDVVVHRVDIGGMFGVRGEFYPEDFLVPWASRVLGKPVKWVEDRREHFLTINHSRDHSYELELTFDGEGRFHGLKASGVLNLGAYPRPIGGRITQIAAESLPGPYIWRSIDVDCRGVGSNKTPAGTIRGPSSYEVTFVRERAIDMAARVIGMEPIEIRRRNLVPASLMPYTQELGPNMHAPLFDTGDYHQVLEATLEAAQYSTIIDRVAKRRAAGEVVGTGIGVFLDHSGIGKTETVRVGLETDGTFAVSTSASEVGQGLDRTVATVVAEKLRVPVADVSVWSGDSRAHYEGNGTYASRSAIFVGSAAVNGLDELVEIGRQRAAELLGIDAGLLGQVPEGFAAPNEQVVPWKELAPIEVIGRHDQPHATYGFTVQLAVVSIDPGTGAPSVEHMFVGYDIGRVIDAASVQGQLVGASAMGLGGALFEELSYDVEGQPQSTTFLDYLMPTSSLVPSIGATVFENGPIPSNPLGIKGAGEAGIIGVGAAIANAVADALGERGDAITTLPLRPELLRGLIQEMGETDR